MASFSVPLLFYIVLFFGVPILGYPLDKICSKTQKPYFCLNLLKPHSNASLQELGEIVINATVSSVKTTSDKIQSLLSSKTDPKLKLVYDTCSDDYSSALLMLNSAESFLKSRDYGNVVFASSWVRRDTEWCQQAIANASSEGIPIALDNNILENLINVLAVVSTILLRSV